MVFRSQLALVAALLVISGAARAGERSLDAALHHLRVAGEREWSDFPATPEGPRLVVTFRGERNAMESTLRLRQQDVKQTWVVRLNGRELGRLPPDENDTVVYFPIPAGGLADGDNTLLIDQIGKTPDDIRVGEIALDDRPRNQVLSETTLEVRVQDADRPAELIPCRITVLNARGAFATVGADSNEQLAVRPGVVYTNTGAARFGLPAGEYTVTAGRGFEYGRDTAKVTLRPGEVVTRDLTIRREVPTAGYVACDPHIHTLTYSGHGDATIGERVVTLAGEGIELPIATEHNRQVDYHAAAVAHHVRQYFTPVVGNEVTTRVGHVNVFPLAAGGPLPDAEVRDWPALAATVAKHSATGVAILNHPRDLHSNFRPFGPARHLAPTGESLDGWQLPANAMEVVNSGAQQTDVLRPIRDWFGLLNRGVLLTPAGASDSHDVSRFIVGQGRTYIRSRDDHPGEIDVAEAVANFRAGRVLVSCGLLADITVNDTYGPGDLVPATKQYTVTVRVLGPAWATADSVALYANGIRVHEARIIDGQQPGVKWTGTWRLSRCKYDQHLVAIALGPGVSDLAWPIAKPYQPTSPVVNSRVIGVSGAVWLDHDGDGKRTSAFATAERLWRDSKDDVLRFVRSLANADESTAAQAASLLRARGVDFDSPPIRDTAKQAGAHVERGFDAYGIAWRESEVLRGQAR